MASLGRKCVWIPNDQMELIYERINRYNEATGKILKVPDALIQILDEYDVMKDAERQSNGSRNLC